MWLIWVLKLNDRLAKYSNEKGTEHYRTWERKIMSDELHRLGVEVLCLDLPARTQGSHQGISCLFLCLSLCYKWREHYFIVLLWYSKTFIPILLDKLRVRTNKAAQSESACLKCVKSWVPCLASQNKRKRRKKEKKCFD